MDRSTAPVKRPAPAAGRSRVWRALWVVPFVLFFFAAPFIGAGTFAWLAGWAYAGLVVLGSIASRVVMARAHPELVAERSRFVANEGTKRYDRLLVPVIAAGPSVIALVAGLNYRFGWPPPVSLAMQLCGLALVLVALVLSTWAMVANRFFSSVMRIQVERGHHVVRGGPYRFVRHPAYGASVPAQVGMALMLGSVWALGPALLLVALTVLRTALEDRALQAELPGYREYAAQVRYRLAPGIW